MTQWSREYLYTGEEKEEKHRPETCVHCSHFKRPEPNSFNWHLRIGTCLLKHRDKGFENWCFRYNKV